MEWLVIGAAGIAILLLSRGSGSLMGSFGAPSSPAQLQAANAGGLNQQLTSEAARVSQANTQAAAAFKQQGGNAALGIGTAAASSASAGIGAIAAMPAIGVLGAATLGVGLFAVGIWAVLSRHHAAAVKNEAHLLNTSYPVFECDFDTIIKAYKSRQINGTDAQSMLDQIRTTYYAQVSGKGAGSIEGKWPWTLGPKGQYASWQQGHPNTQGAENPTAYADVPANHQQPSNCNGPCVVGHWWVEGPVMTAKEAIRNSMKKLPVGQGNPAVKMYPPGTYDGTQALKLSFQVGGAPAHAGYAGSPAVNYAL